MLRERPCAMFDKRYQVSVTFFTVKKIRVVYVSNFFSKYIFSISNIFVRKNINLRSRVNILENIITWKITLKHTCKATTYFHFRCHINEAIIFWISTSDTLISTTYLVKFLSFLGIFLWTTFLHLTILEQRSRPRWV